MLQYVFSDFTVLVKIKSSTAKPVFSSQTHYLQFQHDFTAVCRLAGFATQEVLVILSAHLRAHLTNAGPRFVTVNTASES